MTRSHSLLTGLVVAGAAGVLSLPALGDPPAKSSPSTLSASKQRALIRQIGRTPLSFESNQGQTDAQVRFLAHTADSTLFLTPSEAVFSMTNRPDHSPGAPNSSQKNRKAAHAANKIARVALRMQMPGANRQAKAIARSPLAGRVNYFLGKDRTQWHTDVPSYGKVGFAGVYRGVDLVYYGNQQHLEYDFVVAPHADPKQIQLHFDGAEGIHLDRAGALVVRTGGRELKWQKPVVYQQDASGRQAVSARFRLKKLADGKTGISFVLGRYDRSRPLVIDPVLLYSTYLGGSGSLLGDQAYCLAVDSSGNAYVAGSAGSLNFPTTAGAFQTTNHTQGTVGANGFITKFNPSGSALVYSTYLGGSANNLPDYINGIAVDSAGNAYVTGNAYSADFPTTPGTFQTTRKGAHNAFVTKLNPTGTALVYSTYLGGTTSDGGSKVTLDSKGDAYVVGSTNSTDFPVTTGAFQQTKRGIANAFITQLNPTGTALVYSTYLGGTASDGADAIVLDSQGAAYVAGSTNSTDFPVTAGAFQQAKKGTMSNGFVAALNPTGSGLIYATYLGGSDGASGDSAHAIALDKLGNAYIAGEASSTDFPTTPGAFQHIRKGGTYSTGFVTKLNPTGAALVYSTYLGGSGGSGGNGDVADGIVLDSDGNAYLTGYTASIDFPTTLGAFQRVDAKSRPDLSSNAFVTTLNATGTALIYSTLLGGGANGNSDLAAAIALDSSGAVYVAGYTFSMDFPTTPGAFQPSANSPFNVNAFATKLFPLPVFPDLNNDNFTDLLLQNPTTGAIGSWFMQGSTQVGNASFSLTPPAGFTLVGIGDFGGAGLGIPTLVFQNSSTNKILFWYTGGANHAAITGGDNVNATPQNGWKLVGTGDFNQDGKSDLLFQNQSNGQIAVWFMSGPSYQRGAVLPFVPTAGWNVVGAGDFNKDGFTDILFQNQSSGQLAVWYLNGTIYAGGSVLSGVPAAGWKVAGVGDYNGDGYADVVFTNTSSSQPVVWYLKNGSFLSGSALSASLTAGWTVVGPR